MASSYLQTSSWIPIEEKYVESVKRLLQEASAEIAESRAKEFGCGVEDVTVGIDWDVHEEPEGQWGVWFHAEESLDTDDFELLARAVVEHLQLEDPFVAMWAATCTKPRLDHFTGGGFVIAKGRETYWLDAEQHLREFARKVGSDGGKVA